VANGPAKIKSPKALSEIGRRGGIAGAKKLSAQKRKEIATKASKARTKKAKAKR
jgi:hypothetical protein